MIVFICRISFVFLRKCHLLRGVIDGKIFGLNWVWEDYIQFSRINFVVRDNNPHKAPIFFTTPLFVRLIVTSLLLSDSLGQSYLEVSYVEHGELVGPLWHATLYTRLIRMLYQIYTSLQLFKARLKDRLSFRLLILALLIFCVFQGVILRKTQSKIESLVTVQEIVGETFSLRQ